MSETDDSEQSIRSMRRLRAHALYRERYQGFQSPSASIAGNDQNLTAHTNENPSEVDEKIKNRFNSYEIRGNRGGIGSSHVKLFSSLTEFNAVIDYHTDDCFRKASDKKFPEFVNDDLCPLSNKFDSHHSSNQSPSMPSSHQSSSETDHITEESSEKVSATIHNSKIDESNDKVQIATKVKSKLFCQKECETIKTHSQNPCPSSNPGYCLVVVKPGQRIFVRPGRRKLLHAVKS